MKPVFLLLGTAALLVGAPVKVDWDKVVRESKTTATLQVVVNPPLRRGSAIHDRTFEELRKLAKLIGMPLAAVGTDARSC